MADALHTLESEVMQALRGLDARKTQLTPTGQPEKWSIQQIMEHLLLTYRNTIPVIETRVTKRSPTKAKPTLQQRLAQWAIIRMGRFPKGRLAPAAVAPSRPATVRSGDELLERTGTELAQLKDLLDRGEKLFGNKRAASHMILGPLSMEQWRQFHLVHGRHHLRQIAAIRAERGI